MVSLAFLYRSGWDVSMSLKPGAHMPKKKFLQSLVWLLSMYVPCTVSTIVFSPNAKLCVSSQQYPREITYLFAVWHFPRVAGTVLIHLYSHVYFSILLPTARTPMLVSNEADFSACPNPAQGACTWTHGWGRDSYRVNQAYFLLLEVTSALHRLFQYESVRTHKLGSSGKASVARGNGGCSSLKLKRFLGCVLVSFWENTMLLAYTTLHALLCLQCLISVMVTLV